MKDNKTLKLSELDLPHDLKKLSMPQCTALCREIRKILISTVSENGGHLSSNLGTVELTLAMHRVFSSPADKFIWDVGHQAYTHKLLTGRLDVFSTLRTENGMSGFAKPRESEHDIFISGHSSNSISAACGVCEAMKLSGDDHHVVAVIGDGALTGGMAYEGLNNAGKKCSNLIVILNDNEMSISKNVGAISRYLSSLRGKEAYVEAKNSVKRALEKVPVIGAPVSNAISASKETLRWMLYHSTGVVSETTMFENLGFAYLGPVDGHDIASLEEYMKAAKAAGKPVLIHVKTTKGKGYPPAEKNPGAFHGLSAGAMKEHPEKNTVSDNSFSAVFGAELTRLAASDDRICAVTAAMKYGTGLNTFAAAYPERFYDVGIAEQHAVTFAAGLAVGGMVPVFAVYSSFLQRAYDQVIHDAAISRTHIVIGVDRAGIVGEDGETHQGLLDVPMLTGVPNVTVFSPSDYSELKLCMRKAIYHTPSVAAVRYPRGAEEPDIHMERDEENMLCYEKHGGRILAVCYGRNGLAVAQAVRVNKLRCDVLKLIRIFPIEREITDICSRYDRIIFFEESMESGGIGEHITAKLRTSGFRGDIYINAIGGFVRQCTTASGLKRFGLDKEGAARIITEKMI